MTYNVHGLRAGPWRLARVIRSARPDVVLIQEYGFALGLRLLGMASGMRVIARHRLSRPFQRCALLVAKGWRVRDVRSIELSGQPARDRRALLAAVVERGATEVAVASVHLGLRDGERVRHAKEIADVLGGRQPVVLGGDLNERPGAAAATSLAGWATDAFAGAPPDRGLTFPAIDPGARIDFLFCTAGGAFEHAEVVDTPEARTASDHLPVVAEVRLAGGP